MSLRLSHFRRAVGLSVALLLAGASPAGAIAGFGDVESGRYYTAAVQWMVDEGVTTGTSPSCFSPDGLVTRGQLAAFLWRMEGEPTPPAGHPFADVIAGWQRDAVSWLFAGGTTVGTSPTTYSPNALVTRGEVAAMLHRLAGQPTAPPHPFDDVERGWQVAPVAWLHSEGITTGTSATTFSPDLNLTRGQLATFLHRYQGQPSVVIDPASPTCDGGDGVRQVTQTGYGPFATAGQVTLLLPGATVELIGFHESNHDGARQLDLLPAEVAVTTLDSRGRGTGRRTAADIVVDPAAEVRSPVSGTVVRGGGYTLYCRHRDEFVVIEPTERPGWEVKVLHIDGLRVEVGDRVVAGETVIADHATILPFLSQVDGLTASPSWPHVHIEVVDPSVPDRPGAGC